MHIYANIAFAVHYDLIGFCAVQQQKRTYEFNDFVENVLLCKLFSFCYWLIVDSVDKYKNIYRFNAYKVFTYL